MSKLISTKLNNYAQEPNRIRSKNNDQIWKIHSFNYLEEKYEILAWKTNRPNRNTKKKKLKIKYRRRSSIHYAISKCISKEKKYQNLFSFQNPPNPKEKNSNSHKISRKKSPKEKLETRFLTDNSYFYNFLETDIDNKIRKREKLPHQNGWTYAMPK